MPFDESVPPKDDGQQQGGTAASEAEIKIPVTDGSESFPMAINVKPLEEVERIPGVNAPFGDPDYVDPDRFSIAQESTVEEDIGTAHAEARQVDFDMRESRTHRELAKEDADSGDMEGSKKWAEEARGYEKRARREGYWAGRLYNHPVSQSFIERNFLLDENGDRIRDFTPEVIIDLEDKVSYYQRIIDAIRSGRASDPDYKPPEPSSAPTAPDSRTRDLVDAEGPE